jgi:ABC-type sugar transport system, permease component
MATNEMRNSSIKRRKRFSKSLVYFIVIVLSVIFLIPFLWMLVTSFKSFQEIYQNPPTFFPHTLYLGNYVSAVTKMPFLRYFFNTFLISALCVIGTVISSSMVAYSMSKVKWKGSRYLFPVIVGTMMIPTQVTMIPLYIVFTRLNFVGTIIPLVLPTFFGGAYYIFLLRQFFKTLPDALIESATIDGAKDFTIFSRIILPLCKPAITSVAIFTFLANWSDFLGPLLYLNKDEEYTLSLGLQAFMQVHFVEWGPLMAASAIFTVPIIILFFFAQSYFIEGITITGIKG